MKVISRATFPLAWLGVIAMLTVTACNAAQPSGAGSTQPPGSGRHITWGTAVQAPGTAAFYDGSRTWRAQITSISCASPGNCGAGGYFSDWLRHLIAQPFVISQVNGTWGRAEVVPGLAALTNRKDAEITSVSCGSPGNCGAGGYYRDPSGHERAFVVTQVDGSWTRAMEVPGSVNRAADRTAAVSAVSCPSPGNCAAGGFYAQGSGGRYEAFVVSQVNGTWGRAAAVPGLAALNKGNDAGVVSLSCPSADNCTLVGNYASKPERDFSIYSEAFAASEVGGVWGTARKIPAVNNSGYAVVSSASCASAGDCAASGLYVAGPAGYDGPDNGNLPPTGAFVVNSVHGTWGPARPVRGSVSAAKGGGAKVTVVSCPSAGNCGAAGSYDVPVAHSAAFVLNQAKGTWSAATAIPGLAALDKGRVSGVTVMSCASAGNCSAGGYYRDGSGRDQGFVVNQVNGIWGTAEKIPGTEYASVAAISCAAPDQCSAGGGFSIGRGTHMHMGAFVVSTT